ncbi:hypothetical protein HAX54_009480, partial [Datura stramonium]|nr:hypothetical protein [Datura stramonium]
VARRSSHFFQIVARYSCLGLLGEAKKPLIFAQLSGFSLCLGCVLHLSTYISQVSRSSSPVFFHM